MLVYCVTFEFLEGFESKVDEFLERNFEKKDVIKKERTLVKVKMQIDEDDGPGELENEIYYLLQRGQIGVCKEYKEC